MIPQKVIDKPVVCDEVVWVTYYRAFDKSGASDSENDMSMHFTPLLEIINFKTLLKKDVSISFCINQMQILNSQTISSNYHLLSSL